MLKRASGLIILRALLLAFLFAGFTSFTQGDCDCLGSRSPCSHLSTDVRTNGFLAGTTFERHSYLPFFGAGLGFIVGFGLLAASRLSAGVLLLGFPPMMYQLLLLRLSRYVCG